ncbi:MAG: UDP-2,3-diacylglucosamine diphosphatase [Gammaproteobacteria bacterium]|jgi:UDP-2,3-diacylglucosamine hydrolase
MTTLLVSDLHLDSGQPEIIDQFLDFLSGDATSARALFILGDLFESWIGDDDPDPAKHRVVRALHALTASGTDGFFMAGNRDFLVGNVFEARSGFRRLEDPAIMAIEGEPVLLMHGDTLCTDDVEYQRFRGMVRDPIWQQHFLARSADHRIAMVRQARDASRIETSGKPAEIMDVNQAAVEQAIREHGVHTLIHGHTHRPAIHHFVVDETPSTRIVLGDWHQEGSVLRWDGDGYQLLRLPR